MKKKMKRGFRGFWRKMSARRPRGSFARPAGRVLVVEVEDESHGKWPTVHITGEAHGKMRALIEACQTEVSWLATCARSGDNVTIDDIFVPSQYCSTGSTDVTPDGEAELLSALITEQRLDAIRRLNCWGHSHVSFEVFASGIDEAQTQDFLARSKDTGKDFFVRLIANKWDDLFATLYLFDQGMVFHDVPLRVDPPETEKWRAWARSEVQAKVQKMRIVKVKTTLHQQPNAAVVVGTSATNGAIGKKEGKA